MTSEIGTVIEMSAEQHDDIDDRLMEYLGEPTANWPSGKVHLGMMVDGKLIAGVIGDMSEFWIMNIATLWVDEEYRRRGIALRLMQELEKRAREQGAKVVRLDAFDAPSAAFYHSIGYEELGQFTLNDGSYTEHLFVKQL
jgi:ribosomal protein S18 acetylase RimI-like enzyme